MEKIMTTPGLFLIRDNIFGHLSYEDIEICCKVSVSWNESLNQKSSLKRQALVKYLLEFGGKHLKDGEELKKVYEIIPGWNKAVKKVGSKANLDDLLEIKESLRKYDHAPDKDLCPGPNIVFWAAKNGDLELMKLFFETSYDMNFRDGIFGNIFREACGFSKSTEMVQLIIDSSKDGRIDLNMRDDEGMSAFHVACMYAPLKITKLLFENYKELGIDIKHEDSQEDTALDIIIIRLYIEKWELEDGVEEWKKFKYILKEEYAKIDALEPAA